MKKEQVVLKTYRNTDSNRQEVELGLSSQWRHFGLKE